MDIADAGTTGHFVLLGTPVNNIKLAEKPLCINLPDGKQIKSTHICQIEISWITEASTRSHILPGLAHTSLIPIKMLCDAGCKV